MMRRKDYLGKERRKYIRLDSVFPVQFRLITLDGKHFLSEWLQGFTNNIGKGGICLSVNNLNPELAEVLKTQKAKLSLDIEMPITRKPLTAYAKVVWVNDVINEPNKYLIGLIYEEIDPYQNKKVIRYAITKKYLPPSILALVVILSLALVLNGYLAGRLIRGNQTLIAQLVKILQESSVAKQKIKEINREKEDLQLKMQVLQLRIQTAAEEKKGEIDKLTQEKASLQERLIALQQKENIVTEEFLRLDKKKAALEKANLDKMYQWLLVHQNPRTALVMSFEGDSDIANWAFTYDQALVIQVYTNFSDFSRAKKLLNFFKEKAKRIDGRFVNAYYVNDGSPAEYVVHSGPNIWLGIAILHYLQKTKDTSYLNLAEEIAQAAIHLQNQDADGGIRGGPNVEWFATEHNLDAYAFFNMLYKITNKLQYAQARDKVLNWLILHTYDKTEIPIKRGKGDSTIATDTYAWSVASLGPEKLEEIGMHPDKILEFAEKNCLVEVSYTRADGQAIKIKGFDFMPQRHISRGSVVSSEWTAQMILAFKIMAVFYYKKGMPAKAHAYEMKADEYLSGLGNLIISSPSPSGQGEGCLPYATQGDVDTGHGWRTPKGESTCSVAGTAYTIFAYYNYNPLELKE